MIYEVIVNVGLANAVVPVEAEDAEMAEDDALEIVGNILCDYELGDLVEDSHGPDHTVWMELHPHDLETAEGTEDDPVVVSSTEITDVTDSECDALSSYYASRIATEAAA